MQAAMDAYDGHLSAPSAYAGAAFGGAVAGATAGLASAAGAGIYGTSVGSSIAGNVAAGLIEDGMNGRGPTIGSAFKDAVVGGVMGVVGGVLGAKVGRGVNNLSNMQKGKLGESLTRANETLKGYKDRGRDVVETGATTRTGRPEVAKFDHRFENRLTGVTKTCESKCGFHARPTPNQAKAIAKGHPVDVVKTDPEQLGGLFGGTVAGSAAAGSQKKDAD